METPGFMLGWVIARWNEQLFSFLRRLMRLGKGDYFTEGLSAGLLIASVSPLLPKYLGTFVAFLVLLWGHWRYPDLLLILASTLWHSEPRWPKSLVDWQRVELSAMVVLLVVVVALLVLGWVFWEFFCRCLGFCCFVQGIPSCRDCMSTTLVLQ